MIQEFVKTLQKDNTAFITFYHPQSNSLPSNLLQQLAKEINLASNNKNIKTIVLQSEGSKAFCAGASFDELITLKNKEEATLFFMGFANVINSIRNATKFVIAKVHEKAIGGGVGIIATCDFVIASNKASIKLSELSIGLGPFVIAAAIERKIGIAAFSELTINSIQWKNAEWAKQKGLFAEVVSNDDELSIVTNNVLQTINNYDSTAVEQIKKVMWNATPNWDNLLLQRAEMVAELALSDNFKNKIKNLKK